ncbi:hypothetical protein [Rhodoferax sp.]|uniref:hypothetical protein n=1 Tax=Rhodoferax sp. TaxID=50421 RepID=UPI0026071286|nr:hypothetical protein [Rhodoferax sp.]MDD2927178.1 hypothetical protein [Rhodoferax sp.]
MNRHASRCGDEPLTSIIGERAADTSHFALTLRQLNDTQARIDCSTGATRWQILEWDCAERCF